jgi:DNA repair exonuclease SbcCD ATPase subunit
VILHGIQVQHWCCIASLDLDELPGGIVVLHGPNRTGKSSLVKAIRGCLFDFDHDTAKSEFKNCLPDNGAGPPKVIIEFEVANQRYRLSKIFSRRADGLARLERRSGPSWQEMGDSSKEATRKTRELFGIDKSHQGLNQLLWLDQGVVFLPEVRDLDASLEKRLVAVLGVMVTSRDFGFKQLLDKRSDTWFGVRGEHKPTSPVRLHQKRLEECQMQLTQEQAKFREVERAIDELTECQRQLPICEKQVQDAKAELQELLTEQVRSGQRRLQYQQGQRDYQAAAGRVDLVQQKIAVHGEAKTRWQESEQQSVRAEAELHVHRQEHEQLKAGLADLQERLATARSAEEQHQAAREDLEDRSTLLSLQERRNRMEKDSRRALDVHAGIEQLQSQIRENAGPDTKALESLRDNRRQAEKLRALIQAETLALKVSAKRLISVQLKLDSESAQVLQLSPQEDKTWLVRDQVGIEIPQLLSIEIARSKKSIDLDCSVHTLTRLDHEYRDALLSFGESVEDEGTLNRLSERRIARELATGRLDTARAELQQLAPHGVELLQNEQDQLEGQRRRLLGRRPDLAEWQPDEPDLTERTNHFRIREQSLQKTRKEIEQAVDKSAKELQAANERLWNHNEKAVVARTSAQNALEDLKRLEDGVTLAAQLKEAQVALTETTRRLQETELTDAEKTIDERCRNAATALEVRQRRLDEIRLDLERLRGRLEGSEGLHSCLTEAEAAVVEAEAKLARETAEAAAHKRLRDLFEECRDSQVDTVMGPIAERVLGWAQAIGLGEYRELRFGDRFLPEGIISRGGDPERPRSLSDESYGTSEQLGLLIRLALGGVLAKDEPQVAILDDPLAHADSSKHRRILDIIRIAAEGNSAWTPPAGKLQVLILTCHPDRFDYLTGAKQIDLAKMIVRERPSPSG